MTDTEKGLMRLALYSRVSTEEQRDGQTIESQIAELEQFARAQSWVIVDSYKDDGWSGSVMGRPELDRLRDDARRGRFQAVLINDVDRLARDVAHLAIIKRDLEVHKVQVVFRKLPPEATPMSNLMVNILGSFAEFERELIIDRTRRGRRHKVETRRQYLGCNTAYGFRYQRMDRINGKAGQLNVEEKEARVVQQMFNWVDVDRLSASRVADRLNEQRVAPRKSRRWAKSSVLRILHNEMYTGIWHYNKFQCCEPRLRRTNTAYLKRIKSSLRQRPRGEWISLQLPRWLWLVPRDRWERVQTRLKENLAFSPRNEKHSYLLKGLIQCGGCGSRYVGDPCHGRFYYRCAGRCNRLPAVRECRMEQLVLEAARKIEGAPRNLRSLPRPDLRNYLRNTINVAVFDDSRITIHRRPASDSSFPGL
jgi:site-specific DNA recombinase